MQVISEKLANALFALMWIFGIWAFFCSIGMLYSSFGAFQEQTVPPNYEYEFGLGLCMLGGFWGWIPSLIIGSLIRVHHSFRRCLILNSSILLGIIAIVIDLVFRK